LIKALRIQLVIAGATIAGSTVGHSFVVEGGYDVESSWVPSSGSQTPPPPQVTERILQRVHTGRPGADLEEKWGDVRQLVVTDVTPGLVYKAIPVGEKFRRIVADHQRWRDNKNDPLVGGVELMQAVVLGV